jgi:HAD superfamily hydrolase (TIGR01458 family)
MAQSVLPGVRALVSDIDGVLYHLHEPIPGGSEALEELRRRGFRMRFLTNITRRSRATVAQELRDMGYTVEDGEVLTASYLAASYLQRLGRPRCWVVLDGDGRLEFDGLELTEEDPEYVVLGDRTRNFTYDLLNRILGALWKGAEFIAMQADPYDMRVDGPKVNVGGWLALLERSSGRQALLIGKPSPLAFEIALEDMGVTADKAIAIGDRVGSDIVGGEAAGLRTVLVRTGHFRPQDLEGVAPPDLIVDSLADLPQHLPLKVE